MIHAYYINVYQINPIQLGGRGRAYSRLKFLLCNKKITDLLNSRFLDFFLPYLRVILRNVPLGLRPNFGLDLVAMH